jgi:photosystem II stability/assembly factor-like uncharacterized protein
VWALVAGNRLFRSVDRGDTWQERSVPSSASNVRVSFINEREGWMQSDGSLNTPCPTQSIKVWHTGDGAASWSEIGATGIAATGCKGGIDFVSPTMGFIRIAGDQQAFLYRTTDGGRTWSATAPMAEPPGFVKTADVLYWTGPVHAFGSALLASVERQSNPGGTSFVYRSVDDGATWTYLAKLPFGRPGIATAVRWVQLLVPGQSQETTDAGATWHPYTSDYSQSAPVVPQIEFGDPLTAYATARGFIQRTVDGGAHWTQLETPGTR